MSIVFIILRENQLLDKLSECSFGKSSIGFLGHIISFVGVKLDPDKIKAMIDWKIPKTLKKFKGFSWLTRYLWRFIRNYAQIASSMTNLLKKDNFMWTEKNTKSFEDLKITMTITAMLTFPDFDKHFIFEVDACINGIGVVFIQEDHPVAFYSCKSLGK